MNLSRNNLQPVEAAELMLGEVHPLVDQLGSTEGLVELNAAASALSLGRLDSVPALQRFLTSYQTRLLGPVELPAILRAWHHTSRHEVRELIGLDHELREVPLLQSFASASQRVGRSQLRRLRPLRDQRVVQRYLLAVDEGRAHGWHTLVYGMTLSLYSLPLRQGLLSYARQTLRGFVYSAAGPLQLSEQAVGQLCQESSETLPASVEAVFASQPDNGLLIVQ